jgi:hypothetical protein
MYQPYPGGTELPEVRPRPTPPSVRTAVKLMYGGADASLIGIVIDLTTLSATKTVVDKHSPDLTAAQVNGLQHTLVAGWVVGGLVGAGLWVFVAHACRSGKNWARITGTLFFAIATADVFANLAVPEAALVKIYWFVIWLIGLGAVVFLWRASSSAFFTGARR